MERVLTEYREADVRAIRSSAAFVSLVRIAILVGIHDERVPAGGHYAALWAVQNGDAALASDAAS